MNTNKGLLKAKHTTLLLVGFFTACAAGYAGEVTGKITLKGTPRPEITIDMGADPACAKMHSTPVTTRHYVVAPDGGLAEVFVYIKDGLKSKDYPPQTVEPVLEQKGCFYVPYVLGVRVNQPFKIVNTDATMHNVHALPKENKDFNFAQPMQGMTSEKKFDKPEVLVKFKCDVHPWMFAYMGVVDHPFFAVTATDGTFKIPNLPAGKYVLAAIHPKAGELTQEISVGEGETKTVSFTFEAKPAK